MTLPVHSASPPPSNATDIALRDFLVLPRAGQGGRSPVFTDAVEARIVAGEWTAPSAGEKVSLPNGQERVWASAKAGEDGWLESRALGGGYAYASVEADSPRVILLEAAGHSLVYVNGELRVGDPYAYDYVKVPVMLREGKNDLLFQVSRGRLKAKLTVPPAPVSLDTRDSTLPDLRVGEKADTRGAVVVLNVTDRTQGGLSLIATVGGKSVSTSLPPLPPFTVRKVGFRIQAPPPAGGESVPMRLQLKRKGGRAPLHSAEVPLRVRKPEQTYKATFVSDIDGSVQYYAVNPADPAALGDTPPALFLSLHGASVEAIGQADAYASKRWGHIVAPTNRRPYGYDWEDWGRLDAMEVLEVAKRTLHTDPRFTYLTGHSMGGHGTWQIGVTYPDKFAAIGPSAGWISFFSYAGGRRAENPDPVEAILDRAANPSDTLALLRNTLQQGVYILHGDADDNVPVTEAREMADHLKAFHRDYTLYEQPGAGHWWDASPEPGADCVDWRPMFDLFGRRSLPSDDRIREIEFTTAGPGISAWDHWVGIEAQVHPLAFSTVKVAFDPHRRVFTGTTENVARLALDLKHVPPGAPVTVELDGQSLKEIPYPAQARRLWLARNGEKWELAESPAPEGKTPDRYGPFKDAFRHRMQFVYGTKGTPEENAWAFGKARYDAETFYYRGNGSIDVLPDTAFHADREKDRGVILYGNADTNAAWTALLKDSPVQVRRGSVRVGTREAKGEDLACLFLRPRPGSAVASVGVVSGSGLTGMRLTNRLGYLSSGVHYPDFTLLGADMLARGSQGVRAAGFFGNDWGVESGDFAWR